MPYLNENYLKLQAGYLFPEIARRVREFCEKNPDAAKRLVRCGIGDVTEPLPQAAINPLMSRGPSTVMLPILPQKDLVLADPFSRPFTEYR